MGRGSVKHFSISVTVSAADPGTLFANETKSSPSHVTSLKGSSLWLTWGYEYGGDIPGIIIYREQIIGFSSSLQAALQPVAKRTGANGALQLVPTVPAPFSGRLKVIPSNDTLVISRLKYNDTAYQFASYVITDIYAGGSSTSVKGDLRPAVRITVNGVPEFVTSPPATIEVNENSNLEIAIEMDGNPAPSADFLWPHLGDGGTTVAGIQIYPYVYSAKFSHPNIAATFCGRILKFSMKNSAGSSFARDTNVTVLLKLDGNPNLQAGKIIVDSCVEAKWTKAESGACHVKYELRLKDALGIVVYTETGYNINEIKKCKIPGNVNITDVEMTMSFKTISKIYTAKVSEAPIPRTLPPTTTLKTSKTPVNSDEEKDNIIIALSVVVAVLLIAMATMHFYISVTVTALNKGQLIANDTKSSSSHVTSLKGSSQWLTWGYEYGGDIPGFITYKEQIIGFNSSSQAALQPVAKRTGANGAFQLEPTVPVPFSGRLQIIPSNDTLVISGLKYNDTAYQFASYIITDIITGSSSSQVRSDLKPVVRITVNGVPEFLTSPPATVEVNENSNLEIAIEMDGNPTPSADFLWPHHGDGGTTVAGIQIYPYVYSAKFSHPNIAASYCGRILKSSVKNSVGSSLAKDTYVTVLLKLDGNLNLRAGKIFVDSCVGGCVEVRWMKNEHGACSVKYEVKLKNASGAVVYYEIGYNIYEIKKCKIPGNVNITDVEMTM
eukprot:gene14964-6117_t